MKWFKRSKKEDDFFSVRKLELKKNDMLIVDYKNRISMEQLLSMQMMLRTSVQKYYPGLNIMWMFNNKNTNATDKLINYLKNKYSNIFVKYDDEELHEMILDILEMRELEDILYEPK